MVREREREREELLLPNYSDWAGFAGFTQIGHGSKLPVVPTWPPSNTEPLTAKSGDEKSPKKKKRAQKLWVIIFFPRVSTVKSPSLLPSPSRRFVASFGLYFFFFLRKDGKKEGKKLVHHHPDCPTHAVDSSAFLFFQLPFSLARSWSPSLGPSWCCVPLPQPQSPLGCAERPGRSAAPNYSIWKLWAARQRQTVARCVQDREPCFSTGSPGITFKGSWRKWREGRNRSRAWRRGCSSTGESR